MECCTSPFIQHTLSVVHVAADLNYRSLWLLGDEVREEGATVANGPIPGEGHDMTLCF